MKKIVGFVAALLLLTACGTKDAAKESVKKESASNSKVTSSSSKKEESSSTSTTTTTTTSSSAEAVEQTEIYTMNTEDSGVVQVTLVYKGDKFLRIELHNTNKIPDSEQYADYDFGTVRSELLAYLDQDADIQHIRSLQGVVFAMDITPEYNLITDLHIDMTTVDLVALSQVENIGVDFTEIQDMTPATFILGLTLNGATRVN